MGLDSSVYFLFLGVVVLVHALLPPRGRVALLLCASLAFYAVSSAGYAVLFLIVCALNYAAASALARDVAMARTSRARILVLALALDLGLLLTFKYAIHSINLALGGLGWSTSENHGAANILVPLGLSYFSFQMIGCMVDSYSRRWKLEGGFLRFLTFGFFFPQISSGPIPRAGRLCPQLDGHAPSSSDRLLGLKLIAFGLFKKYAVANRLDDVVNQFFNNPVSMTALPAMVGCCLNAVQLYADFSGYTDIAIGSARLLGIGLDPNFDRPYLSVSVTELWRRWHMTLSFWLRDYFFTPLAWLLTVARLPQPQRPWGYLVSGIRRCGKLGIVIALMVSFAVIGLWHAATWPFLVFGLAQGAAISLELLSKSWRQTRFQHVSKRGLRIAGRCYTMIFFVLSLVLFRAVNLAQAERIYGDLLNWHLPDSLAELLLYKGPILFPLALIVILIWERLAACLPKSDERATPWFVLLCAVLTLLLGRLGSPLVYAGF